MDSARKWLAAAVAVILVIAGVAIKEARNVGHEVSSAGVFRDLHGDPFPRPTPAGVDGLGSLGHERGAVDYEAVARQIFCAQLSNLVGPDGFGEITPSELFESVVHNVTEHVAGAPVFAIEDFTSGLMTAGNLDRTVSPGAAQAYLRSCPPY